MEGCPAKSELTTYTVLSGLLGLFLFLVLQSVRTLVALGSLTLSLTLNPSPIVAL